MRSGDEYEMSNWNYAIYCDRECKWMPCKEYDKMGKFVKQRVYIVIYKLINE